MKIRLDRIDYHHDIITDEDDIVLATKLYRVEVDYILTAGKHELEGKLELNPVEYKEFRDDEEIIEFIKEDITNSIQ